MSLTPHYQKVSAMRVVSLHIQETGTYNQQYSRPYVTDIDQGTLNMVSDRVNRSIEHAEKITPMTLQGLGNSIVQPSPTIQGNVSIINGWDQQKLRFILNVECEYASGGRSHFHYTGYTSYVGVSTQSASIDPDMEFVVNSVVRTRITNSYTPHGAVATENMVASKNVLCDPSWGGSMAPQQMYMMRPEDIINYKAVSHVLAGSPTKVIDSRHLVQKDINTSSTNNGLAHNYAASIINSHVQAFTHASISTDEGDILGEARRLVPEMMDNPLLSALASLRASSVVGNVFTKRELERLDPNLNHVLFYTPLTVTDMHTVHRAGQTANWDGSDPNTVNAFTLSQAVPAIMSGLMLRSIAFTSTNSNITGQIFTSVSNSMDFSRQDVQARTAAFVHRLENEVIHDMTFGNNLSYFMSVTADLLGDIWITIAMDGNSPVDYVFPAFGNSILTPVITPDAHLASNTAENFGILMDHVREMASDIPTTVVETTYV